MVDIGRAVKPVLAVKYPHMMPEDTVIWRRFISGGAWCPDELWYDVRVGAAVEVESGQPSWMKRMAEYSTRKRIDVVGRVGVDYWIIEAKPRAGVVALGQVMFYSRAFKDDYKPTGRVVPVIVTDVADSDVLTDFRLWGVVVFEVGVEKKAVGA